MTLYQPSGRPRPECREDIDRWAEASKRLCMQDGDWRCYVERRMWEFFDQSVIDRIYSGLDISSNAKKLADEKKSTLYDTAPTVSFIATDDDRKALQLSRLWALSQSRHLITNVANESLVRVDWEDGVGLTYRTVTPDFVEVESTSQMPDVPIEVKELRIRELPNGEDVWTWDVFDVKDPSRPYFAIWSGDRKQDLTPLFMPRLLTDPGDGFGPVYVNGRRVRQWYPYEDNAGWPILPYAMHHRQLQHRLWNWQSRREIVDGTITAACLRTWYVSGIRDHAQPQRYGIGVRLPQAANLRGRAEADRVTVDQGSILMFEQIATGGTLGTLEPAMDPAVALDSIERYNASLLEGDGLGIEPSNTSRMSGYAIVVSRDSLRRVQRQQQPAALQGDRQILSIAARMLNAYEGRQLPEDGESYQIGYQGIEFSLEEIRSRLEQVQALRSQRLMTRVDAMLTIYPSLTPDEARAKLAEIDAEETAAVAPRVSVALTDPSSGAPMRTPRGIAHVPDVTDAEDAAVAEDAATD